MAATERIPCPVCGEKIVAGARVCRFCGEKFDVPEADTEGDATGGVIPYKNPPALIAYYCGLFSLLACIPIFLPLPIVALYCGIKGLKKAKAEPHVRGKVHAWIGIVGGSIFTVVGIVMAIGAIATIISAMNEGKLK